MCLYVKFGFVIPERKNMIHLVLNFQIFGIKIKYYEFLTTKKFTIFTTLINFKTTNTHNKILSIYADF